MMHYFKNPPKPSVRINRYKINFILFFFLYKIYDQKLTWHASPTMNTRNEEYIQHKERERILREQRARTSVQVEIFLFFFELNFLNIFLGI